MSARENILNRLRQAEKSAQEHTLPHVHDQELYRDFPEESPEVMLDLFARRLVALQGEFYAAASELEAAEKLLHILSSAGDGLVAVQEHTLLHSVVEHNTGLRNRLVFEQNFPEDAREFAAFEAGITTADWLIARSGSILLRTNRAGGRRLSVLPPLHVVIATTGQLVPSLEQGLDRIRAQEADWSYMTLITGPSRTADIEKILVLGAHGPKRLAVIVIEQN